MNKKLQLVNGVLNRAYFENPYACKVEIIESSFESITYRISSSSASVCVVSDGDSFKLQNQTAANDDSSAEVDLIDILVEAGVVAHPETLLSLPKTSSLFATLLKVNTAFSLEFKVSKPPLNVVTFSNEFGNVDAPMYSNPDVIQYYLENCQNTKKLVQNVSHFSTRIQKNTNSEEMFLINNVFYSLAEEQADSFEGNPDAAHYAVSKDLRAIERIRERELSVGTVGSCVVDYLGKRMVCQTVVPGMFLQNQPSDVSIYGQIETSLKSSEKFTPFAKLIANLFHLEPLHTIDDSGVEHELLLPLDCKGLECLGDKFYVVDLWRCTPLDVTFFEQSCSMDGIESTAEKDECGIAKDGFPNYMHEFCVTRHELVDLFIEFQMLQQNASTPNPSTNGTDSAPNETSEPSQQTAKKARENSFEPMNIRFNTNLFSFKSLKNLDPADKTILQKSQIWALSRFLHETILNTTVSELLKYPETIPIEGLEFTRYLHARGINMRLLGKFLTSVKEKSNIPASTYVQVLCQEQIVYRCVKALLRKSLSNSGSAVATIIQFFNSLFVGCNDPTYFNEICEQSRIRFRYDLSEDEIVSVLETRRSQVVRLVCLKLGIQILPKQYSRFSKDDIVNVYPVIKTPNPNFVFIDNVTAHAQNTAKTDAKAAIKILVSLGDLINEIYGPVHSSLVKVYKLISYLHSQLNDKDEAIAYCILACRVAEKNGLVNETIFMYLSLGNIHQSVEGVKGKAAEYFEKAFSILSEHLGDYDHCELANAFLQYGNLMNSEEHLLKCRDIMSRIKGTDHEDIIRINEVLAAFFMKKKNYAMAYESQKLVADYLRKRAGNGAEDTRIAVQAARILEAFRRIKCGEIDEKTFLMQGLKSVTKVKGRK